MADRPGGRDVITGLVLAGGRSSRMGEDKALLRIDGRTLLERTMDALRDAGAGRIVVSGSRDAAIPDRWPEAGPVGGIASAVDMLEDGDCLVVPVDMPRLGEALLAPLLAERSRAATCWAGYPLPMRLRIDSRAREALADMMTRTGRACSVSALLECVGTMALPLDALDTRLLVNCNTPDEWREATR